MGRAGRGRPSITLGPQSWGAPASSEWPLWPWPQPRRYPDLRNRGQSRLDLQLWPQLLLSRGQVHAAAAPSVPVAGGRGNDYCPQIWAWHGRASRQVLYLLHLLRQEIEIGMWSALFHYAAPALGRRHPDLGLEKPKLGFLPPTRPPHPSSTPGWGEPRPE